MGNRTATMESLARALTELGGEVVGISPAEIREIAADQGLTVLPRQ